MPQLIFVVLTMMSLGLVLAKDGETTTHSFWWSLIAQIINYSLLYWGGFFDVFFIK